MPTHIQAGFWNKGHYHKGQILCTRRESVSIYGKRDLHSKWSSMAQPASKLQTGTSLC